MGFFLLSLGLKANGMSPLTGITSVGQTDWSLVSSNEGAAPVHYGEEGAKLAGDAFSLLALFRSNPHLWSRDLGNDRKNEVADAIG